MFVLKVTETNHVITGGSEISFSSPYYTVIGGSPSETNLYYDDSGVYISEEITFPFTETYFRNNKFKYDGSTWEVSNVWVSNLEDATTIAPGEDISIQCVVYNDPVSTITTSICIYGAQIDTIYETSITPEILGNTIQFPCTIPSEFNGSTITFEVYDNTNVLIGHCLLYVDETHSNESPVNIGTIYDLTDIYAR